MSTRTIVETSTSATTPAAEDRVREVLERVRREPEPPAGWVFRKQRTSPLETRYVTR
jgi:hypothetical protein